MRKYLFCTLIPVLFYLSSLSQFTKESEAFLYAKIDSLKKAAPKLTGKAKVDCLNTIVDQYQIMDEDNQMQIDSAGPFARQAYDNANKIGYKRGLGYACLKLSYINLLWGQIHNDANKHSDKYTDSLNSIEKLIAAAIQISKELNDFTMRGSGYALLGWLERLKGNKESQIKHIKEAISYIEQQAIQTKNDYKEMNYSNCSECNGQEFRLAELYSWLGNSSINKSEASESFRKALPLYKKARAYPAVLNTYYGLVNTANNNGNLDAAKEYTNEAISYFELTGENNSLGEIYSYLRWAYFRAYQYKLSEEAALKSISYYQKAKNVEDEITQLNEMCKVYDITGEFEKGVYYGKRSIQLVDGLDHGNIKGRFSGMGFFWLCNLYKIAGDYETALDLIRRGRNYIPNPVDSVILAFWSAQIGDVHRLMGNYDSALFYLKPFEKTVHNNNNFGKVYLGFLYNDLKEYDKALQLIKPFTIFLTNQNRFLVPAANSLMITAKALLGEKKYKDALQDAREAQIHLTKLDGRVMMIANYKLLSDIFSKLNIHDSAYYYLSLHTTLKDSLLNRQFFWRLNSFKKEAEETKKEAKIGFLNRDNKIKEQKLKQESFAKKGLIIGILLLFLLGIFIFRNLSLKRKNDTLRLQKDLKMQQLASEKKQAELHQKAVELEMQALRAQMNPHFIFNCLNSINRFIFKNETKEASDYLTRFSRLIRMVLLHSQKKLVPLEDELEMLKLYLDMERLRFKNAFDYHITTTNAIENSSVFIPPLLLQPFCENAIWHGLMHKEGSGHLTIELNEDSGILNCIITDDGVGREKAEEYKSKSAEKEKSMGLKITKERLSLLNQGTTGGTFYEIEDLRNEQGEIAGTRVQLKIRYKENIEELA